MRNLTNKGNPINLQSDMATLSDIKKVLQTTHSLMQGKLAWNSWSDSVCTFQTPGGPFQARPVMEARPTPERIARFIRSAKNTTGENVNRLLIVPYLPDAMLDELDRERQIMAADLCGNGIIKKLPLYIRQSGCPNRYPDSRPVARPYEKASAQAAMVLLEEKIWTGQAEILNRIIRRGGSMTKGQLSKVIARYEEDGALRRQDSSGIIISRPDRLLDGLLKARKPATQNRKKYYTLPQEAEWKGILKEAAKRGIKWCMSPQYSLQQYTFSGEGAPMSLWTDTPEFFQNQTALTQAPTPEFASLSVIEATSPTSFFQTAQEGNVIWSGPVAAWLAFAGGDARQQAMATPLYRELVDFQCKQLIDNIGK